MPGHRPNILLDAGANAEVQAEWLVQFAQMGSIYARQRFGIEAPTVGLLSIGEEPGKGDTLRKEAFELLSAASGIQFIGNVEGRDLMKKTADVIVTDGFTGNVALKTLEGALKFMFATILGVIGTNDETRAAGDVLLGHLLPLAADLDTSPVIANDDPREVAYNIFQALQYLADWLCGNGCVALPARLRDRQGRSVAVRIMDDLATTDNLQGNTWGMVNEAGSWPGQMWLAPFSFWYQLPAFNNEDPNNTFAQTLTDNADAIIFMIMMVVVLLFVLVPFVPGLRSIPRWIPISRLVWKDYYREYGRR